MASYDNDKLAGTGYAQPASANSLDAKRRAALDEVDNAKFSRFHVKACAVAGVGFFTDAYDSESRRAKVAKLVLTTALPVFSISIAATMIGYVYHAGGKNTANQDLGIKVAHSIGTFFGQLLFGWLADVVGRKRMYGVELMIIIIGTLVSGAMTSGGRFAHVALTSGSSRLGPVCCHLGLRCPHHVAFHHGSGHRRRLPPVRRHHLRVRRQAHSWSHDDRRVRVAGLG